MGTGSSKNFSGSLLPLRGPTGILVVGLVLAFSTGCLEDTAKDCQPTPFTKIIEPVKIDDGHHVYFDIDAFDFLLNPTVVLTDVSFEGAVDHHDKDKNKDLDDVDFDLNGTKTSRCDGNPSITWKCGVKNQSFGDNRWCTSLRRFKLNGGDDAFTFLGRVKIKKGVLKLNLQGNSNNLVDARIVATGTQQGTCTKPPPPPPPPPPPVAPVSTITSTSPATSPSNSTNAAFTFTANQTGVSFSCALDGVSAACSSPQNYSGVANGQHTFSVKATNAAGLSDANPPSYIWTVDTIPPTVTITNASTLPSLTNVNSMAFQFTANQASTFSCSVDGSSAQNCTSPYTVAGVSQGSHTVSISAVDQAGNVSSPATFTWTLDTVPPVASIVLVTPGAAINNSTSESFQFQASESSSFQCAVDNGAYFNCSSPYTLNNIAEGNHWFDVKATDVAGNVGLPVTYSWTTDLTAPLVTIVSSVPAAGPTNAQNVAVSFSLSEPTTSVTCAMDGGTPANCTSPFGAPVTTQGPHELVIVATDIAGNVSSPTTLDWNMDFTVPVLSFGAILPSASPFINQSNVSLQILASKPVTLTATVNGSPFGSFTSPLVLSNLSAGLYNIEIDATDMVGNPADALTYSFTVDLTPPVVTLQAQITGLTNQDSNSFTFSSNKSGTILCNVDDAGYSGCTSPLNVSGLADGDHSVQVEAIDLAGNVSAPAIAAWTVDTTPPVTTLVANQNGLNSTTFTFTSNETPSTFVCSLDGAPSQPCNSGLTVSNILVGFHTFTVQAIDAAGNIDPTGSSYTFDVMAPTTAITLNQAANNNVTLTFTSNLVGATFNCSLDGAIVQICTSPVTVTGLLAGNHNFVARAIDAAGNIDPVGAKAAWIVNNPTTTITGQQMAENALTFTFTSSAPNATYQCSLDGSALQPCTSPDAQTGISVGSHSFTAHSVDSVGNMDPAGATYNFSVLPPISTALTGESPSASLTNSTTMSFTFAASYSNATFVCSLDGAPSSACVSGVGYSGLANGAHQFKVQAIDTFGNLDPKGASYSWTVDTTPPTVLTSSTSSSSTSITITWTTSKPATSKVFWGISPNTNNVVPENSVYQTSHTVVVNGLSPNTVYAIQPAGTDQAGNVYTGGKVTARTGR